jgi:acetyl-CoA synthetase
MNQPLTQTKINQPASLIAERYTEIDNLYKTAANNRLQFWDTQAKKLRWHSPWNTPLNWEWPNAHWFGNGTLNAAENCVDIHLPTQASKPAIIWQGESQNHRSITYQELSNTINQLANALLQLNIKKGDRVTITMPMIPEAIMAMLACSRIGAIHSVVFSGFSAPSLANRIIDSDSKLVITSQWAHRRGKPIELRQVVADAIPPHSNIPVITLNKSKKHPHDFDFYEIINKQSTKCPPVPVNTNHPLFILYTSGTTGKPKGITHGTGGYLTYAKYSTQLVFNLNDSDIFWCTADVGWITGHTYLTYGPLLNGATIFITESTPDYPHKGRFWELIDTHKISIFYTAPTAIRAFMKDGEAIPNQYQLSSLRLLGSVGEPINPDAWMWYYTHIGKKKCPIVDTWWQTETGGIILTSLPGYHPMTPGTAGHPLPGIDVAVVSENETPVTNERGYLTITSPWPSMLQGVWNDPDRYKSVYWNKFSTYFAGDGAISDSDNAICVIGRVDDVLNVAGHRIGTMEIESALVNHPSVAEAAVIGIPDNLKGEAIVAFVILKTNHNESLKLQLELTQHVANVISPIAKPQHLFFTPDCPKTRSGKIMRRILKKIMLNQPIGDTSTIANSTIIDQIKTKITSPMANHKI